ncbi:protein BatD, partial [Lysobacter sp. D1-1-M9]
PAPAPAGEPASLAGDPSITSAAADGGVHRAWAAAALVFAALWLVTLLWALQRQRHGGAAPAASGRVSANARHAPAPGSAALKRALDTGDFGELADILCAMAQPPARDVDALIDRLSDPAQREALASMQRARWGDGDGVAARAQLRAAFARGPHWHEVSAPEASPLPPLYPGA